MVVEWSRCFALLREKKLQGKKVTVTWCLTWKHFIQFIISSVTDARRECSFGVLYEEVKFVGKGNASSLSLPSFVFLMPSPLWETFAAKKTPSDGGSFRLICCLMKYHFRNSSNSLHFLSELLSFNDFFGWQTYCQSRKKCRTILMTDNIS